MLKGATKVTFVNDMSYHIA